MKKRHTYAEFREKVRKALEGEKDGLAWNQLRKKGGIEYTRPCYTWARQLEDDIGLIRERRRRTICWKLKRR